ncbi:MAG: regulatory protein GemA [Lachnospiraceae bacterium]|nr:regulatory protein GemA [Lachnospiraceae bacterium]
MAEKIRTIYAIAKSPQLHMTNEEIHLLVAGMTGKDSLRELSQNELTAVSERLQNMKDGAGDDRRREKNFTGRGNRSTERQRRKMYMLMRELGWNDARVRGLALKMLGTKTIEWMSREQCSALIEGMKQILERQEKAKSNI